MLMKHLTDRQRQVLDFIIDFRDEHGYYPSYREIADGVGFTLKTAACHIEALVRNSHIEKPFGKSRAYQVIEPGIETIVIGGRRVDVGFRHKGKVITEVR